MGKMNEKGQLLCLYFSAQRYEDEKRLRTDTNDVLFHPPILRTDLIGKDIDIILVRGVAYYCSVIPEFELDERAYIY